ncbi:hypothetical protein N2152v2_010183 [Parachlorella kessleri]
MNGQAPKAPTPTATLRNIGQALQDLQGALAARESEVLLLRQQLSQLTSDFKFNLKLLEERDLELERLEAVNSGLKETAAAKELALAETKRLLSEKDTALREKEVRLTALEARQREVVELCEQQVADARASRDAEVARCKVKYDALEKDLRQRMTTVEGIAAREKADIIAGYEKQISATTAVEREARQAGHQAMQENEYLRGQLQRAEARVAEQELAMQRMVTQFEAALQTLQQLESQYSTLVAESAAAERSRGARIAQLEAEVDALRATSAALQGEQASVVYNLTQQVQDRERQLAEAKQRYHRASLDNADLADTVTTVKQEIAEARDQAQHLEEELQSAKGRMYLETAKRDGEFQAQEVARLKERVVLLEAQCSDAAQALEAARVKLKASDERLQLLGEQMEQERASHAHALAAQEEHLLLQADITLAAVQDEKAALQGALQQANRQLQQSYRDVETLRLQLDHLRLAPPPLTSSAAGSGEPGPGQRPAVPGRLSSPNGQLGGTSGGAAALSWGRPDQVGAPAMSIGSSRQHCGSFRLSAQHAGHDSSSPRGHLVSDRRLGDGARYPNAAQHGSEADAASSVSGELFSDIGDDGIDSARGMDQQQQGLRRSQGTSRFKAAAEREGYEEQGLRADGAAANVHQQHLHRHIDSLTNKLGSFERAVARARQTGSQAALEVVQSDEDLPAGLQERQVEVTEDILKKKLSRERHNFLKERQRLDKALEEKDRLLQEREQELHRVQQEREAEALQQRQAELQRKEQELRQLARELEDQQQHHHQQQQRVAASAPASVAGSVPVSPPQQHLGVHGSHQAQALAATAAAPVPSAGTPPSPVLAGHMRGLLAVTEDEAQRGYRPAVVPRAASGASSREGCAANYTAAQPRLQPSQRLDQISGNAPAQAALTMPPQAAGTGASSGPGLQSSSLAAWGALRSAGTSSLRSSQNALQLGHGSGVNLQPAAGAPPVLTRPAGALTRPAAAAAGAVFAFPNQAAAGPAVVDAEDPLAKARRQVMLAKEYLKSVAEMGGKLSRGPSTAKE